LISPILWYPVRLRILTGRLCFLAITLSVTLFAARSIAAQDSSTKKPASTSKTKRHKSTAKKQVAAAPKPAPVAPVSSTATAHRRAPSKSAKRTQPVRRASQQQPTPERYKEIQQSLADKGYFSGPVDGNWGPESVDALKRFQREQNLTDDGKIGSLSLIALGLGPKRGASEPNLEKQVQR
jgi:peptidoglycan hydrolase-like protein with peptidoglycan-binding domain